MLVRLVSASLSFTGSSYYGSEADESVTHDFLALVHIVLEKFENCIVFEKLRFQNVFSFHTKAQSPRFKIHPVHPVKLR